MNNLVADEQATGKVKEVFDDIKANFGMVPSFFRAQAAVDENWLELNWQRWKAIMGRQGSLDRKTKDLIAIAVSMTNNCPYCVSAHTMMAQMAGATEKDLAETIQVVELFASFNQIADSLQVPCDERPGNQ